MSARKQEIDNLAWLCQDVDESGQSENSVEYDTDVNDASDGAVEDKDSQEEER